MLTRAKSRIIGHTPLAQFDMAVIDIEGVLQMVWLAQGFEGGPIKALANSFIEDATAGQLRMLADLIDTARAARPAA